MLFFTWWILEATEDLVNRILLFYNMTSRSPEADVYWLSTDQSFLVNYMPWLARFWSYVHQILYLGLWSFPLKQARCAGKWLLKTEPDRSQKGISTLYGCHKQISTTILNKQCLPLKMFHVLIKVEQRTKGIIGMILEIFRCGCELLGPHSWHTIPVPENYFGHFRRTQAWRYSTS